MFIMFVFYKYELQKNFYSKIFKNLKTKNKF